MYFDLKSDSLSLHIMYDDYLKKPKTSIKSCTEDVTILLYSLRYILLPVVIIKICAKLLNASPHNYV